MTRLPPPAGSAIVEGAVVIGVSGRPVFLMEGEVPVYRTLAPGMAGEDIAQLQAALARLGYSPETDGFFGGGTKLAVRELYRRAGFQVIESSVRAAVRHCRGLRWREIAAMAPPLPAVSRPSNSTSRRTPRACTQRDIATSSSSSGFSSSS